MNEAPIGVFDSGLGGLTAVKELTHLLPYENIVYFGDTGRVPYGTRGSEIIKQYAAQDVSFLLSQQVKMIIAACGTVSSVALELAGSLPVPFTGVVKPTSAAAAAVTRNGRIGIIGTSATIRSGSYRRELNLLHPEIQVFEQDCPLFVPLVENGFIQRNDCVPREVARRYLSPLRDAGVDTLILGCTHYPILREIIGDIMGDHVVLIDSGKETALYASHLLRERHLLREEKTEGECSFYVSDSTEGFSQIAGIFLGQNIKGNVSRIEIQDYPPYSPR